jgi:hypothetical protein
MREDAVRFLAVVAATAFLLLQAAAPSWAHHTHGGKLAGAKDVNVSAANKKKAKKASAKKQEEYLRAVPTR